MRNNLQKSVHACIWKTTEPEKKWLNLSRENAENKQTINRSENSISLNILTELILADSMFTDFQPKWDPWNTDDSFQSPKPITEQTELVEIVN